MCSGSKEVGGSIPGCINGRMAGRGRGVISTLYLALISLHMPPVPKYGEEEDKPEQAQRRATRLVGAGALAHEERLRDWDCFSLGKRRLQGGLTADPQHPPCGGTWLVGWQSWAVHGGRMRDFGQKSKQDVQTGHKETLSHPGDSQRVDQVAQKGCAVSVLAGFQDLTG